MERIETSARKKLSATEKELSQVIYEQTNNVERRLSAEQKKSLKKPAAL